MWMLDRCEWKGWYFWFQKGVILHVHHEYGPWLCDIATEVHRLVWVSGSFGIFLNDSVLLTRKGLSLQSGGHCASIFKQVEHSATKWLLNADTYRYIYDIPVWAAHQHPDTVFHDISTFRHCLLTSLQRPSFADRAEGHLPIWQWMQTSELLSHSRKAFAAKCWSGKCIIAHNIHVFFLPRFTMKINQM